MRSVRLIVVTPRGEREATAGAVGVVRRSLGGRGALWGGFVIVHAALVALNL